jgi:hypothetical protein
MKQYLFVQAGLLGLVLLTGLAIAAVSIRPDLGPVYTVAEVRAHLANDAKEWVGRTILVRAMAEPCPWWGALAALQHCAGREIVLVGATSDAPADPVPLTRQAANLLVSLLRGFPVFGNVLSRPRVIPLFTPTRFAVRLSMLPTDACASRLPCYQALLLDPAP